MQALSTLYLALSALVSASHLGPFSVGKEIEGEDTYGGWPCLPLRVVSNYLGVFPQSRQLLLQYPRLHPTFNIRKGYMADIATLPNGGVPTMVSTTKTRKPKQNSHSALSLWKMI